jgi:hypothetical protein
MLGLLEMPLDLSCVTMGDPGYPVAVEESAKICKTMVAGGHVRMTCDRALLLSLTRDQLIGQFHHEIAINVPGLEPDIGPISTYKISSQLSTSAEGVWETKVVVKAMDNADDQGVVRLEVFRTTDLVLRGTQYEVSVELS